EETKNTSFEIEVRVLRDGYTATLSFPTLGEFPGASFDPTTNIFSWTPPMGFVASKGTATRVDFDLPFVATASKEGESAEVRNDTLSIRVVRNSVEPVILWATPKSREMREGETLAVQVLVR